MIGLLAPFAALAIVGGATHRLLRSARRDSLARKASSLWRRVSAGEASALVAEFGWSANSFMTLYPGFEYFGHPDPAVRGMIAFSDQPDAWVGGAEPFCAPEDRPRLLEAFARAAEAQGKAAILLPVDEKHAELACRSGYRATMIGTEPTFALDRYPRTGRTWTDVVPAAKTLASRGALVTEFKAASLESAARAELDGITREWLGSRKMDALGFLNQVDPWFRAEDKRYFRIDLNGRCHAFLAAIPIQARQGWYLVDLIRRADSPAGATELLLLQAMRLLRESGAREATMGVAPLSGLETADRYACADPGSRRVHRLLRTVYERGNALYNFKPLHQYKLKFDPTSSPAAFMVHRGPLGPGPLLSLARAFMPHGLTRATASGALRWMARFSFSDWLRSQVRSSVVVRSAPSSWTRLLWRCKLTFALTLANLAAYLLAAAPSGDLPPALEARWGFSWAALLDHPLRALALSPFLHWNAGHLSLNLLGLALFTGGLEFLGGTALAALAYFVPMWLANPVTAAVLAQGLKPWIPAIQPSEIDLGASLGVFGCAGAMASLLRWGGWMVTGLGACVAIDALLRGSFLTFDHWVALALGALVSRLRLRA